MHRGEKDMKDRELLVADDRAMASVGKRIADALRGQGACISLEGPLGAGKTTLVRGVLRGLGYSGVVRSPTYTLMEEYPVAGRPVIHLDLYRLADPEELEYLGLRDALSGSALVFVEWAEKGGQAMLPWDLILRIAYRGESRLLTFVPRTAVGRRVAETVTVEAVRGAQRPLGG
jgi:tRNA threonylcarbamoyladenosine biosynthesis protein TsaE